MGTQVPVPLCANKRIVKKDGQGGIMDSVLFQAMFLLCILFGLLFLLMAYTRQITSNKMLCWFLEGDCSARPKLLKVEGDMVSFQGEEYAVTEDRVRNVRYPTGWPSFLQTVVPCSIYERGRFEPLNWVDLGEPGASSKEVGAALDPLWMVNIVKGTKEGAVPQTRLEKFGPILAIALSSICLLLLIYVIQKLGSIQSTIDVLN